MPQAIYQPPSFKTPKIRGIQLIPGLSLEVCFQSLKVNVSQKYFEMIPSLFRRLDSAQIGHQRRGGLEGYEPASPP